MTVRVGAKGQVVIPKAIRETIGLHPGDVVSVELRGDDVVVAPARQLRPLAGRFGASGMAARLVDDRSEEAR